MTDDDVRREPLRLAASLLTRELDSPTRALLVRPEIADWLREAYPDLWDVLSSFDASAQEAVDEEYARLFLLPGGVPPRAAAWIDGALETVGAALSRRVHRHLTRCGREVDPEGPRGRLPLDHVGLLLELGADALGTPHEKEVMDHLVVPWAPQFARALRQKARHPLYRWVAELVRATTGPRADGTPHDRGRTTSAGPSASALILVIMSSLAATRVSAQPAPDPRSVPFPSEGKAEPTKTTAAPAAPPTVLPPSTAADDEGPWRLAPAVGAPEWFRFGARHRTRGEYLRNQFRGGRPGNGGLLSFRTSIAAELQPDMFLAGVELIDSRAYFANDAVALNTTHINPIELLQGYVGLVAKEPITGDDELTLRVGRLTMNIGRRRLMARNRFRNTINTFTGFDTVYRRRDGFRIRAFGVMPVSRRPDDREALLDNDIVYDRESLDFIHTGVAVTLSPLSRFGLVLQGYAFGTIERDGPDRASRDRRLFTPGFRFIRPPTKGGVDFDLEWVAQVGTSRASTDAEDVTDLRHLATFQHASVAYTADAFGAPRFMLQYDAASGDDDRTDGQNNRFDTLFGARRFEYGPTGIYGAIARSNIRSPGGRVEWKPHRMLRGFVGYRALWLDEAADGWTTARIAPAPGREATFVGHQIEARVRFDPWPGNIRLEPGVVQFFPGAFLDAAPTANPSTDSTMVYLQVAGTI